MRTRCSHCAIESSRDPAGPPSPRGCPPRCVPAQTPARPDSPRRTARVLRGAGAPHWCGSGKRFAISVNGNLAHGEVAPVRVEQLPVQPVEDRSTGMRIAGRGETERGSSRFRCDQRALSPRSAPGSSDPAVQRSLRVRPSRFLLHDPHAERPGLLPAASIHCKDASCVPARARRCAESTPGAAPSGGRRHRPPRRGARDR